MHVIKKTMTVMLCLFITTMAQAIVPGKVYTTGDTIFIDSIPMLVFKIDATGTHGKAMSSKAMSSKQKESWRDKVIKQANKDRKQNQISQSDIERTENDALYFIAKVPSPIKITPVRSGYIRFETDDWLTQFPEGFRLFNEDDLEDYAIFWGYGGVGKDYSLSIKDSSIGVIDKITCDLFKQTLISMDNSGFLITGDNPPIRFVSGTATLKLGKYLKIRDKSLRPTSKRDGNLTVQEVAVAVCDF